jgi:hypothetical protein
MSNNGPTFTKATYDRKLPRHDPPSSERVDASEANLARDCEKARARNKLSSAGRYGDVLRGLGLLK